MLWVTSHDDDDEGGLKTSPCHKLGNLFAVKGIFMMGNSTFSPPERKRGETLTTTKYLFYFYAPTMEPRVCEGTSETTHITGANKTQSDLNFRGAWKTSISQCFGRDGKWIIASLMSPCHSQKRQRESRSCRAFSIPQFSFIPLSRVRRFGC